MKLEATTHVRVPPSTLLSYVYRLLDLGGRRMICFTNIGHESNLRFRENNDGGIRWIIAF